MSDLQFSEAQNATIDLAEIIYAYKPKSLKINKFNIGLSQPAEEVKSQLATTQLGELLLPEGATLSAEPTNDYWPELDMFVGRAVMTGVSLSVLKSTYPKYEKTEAGWREDGIDAMYELDLSFIYQGSLKGNVVIEEIGISTSSSVAESTPRFHADVIAAAYAEMGYEGHKQRMYNPTEEQVLGAIALFSDLFGHEQQTLVDRQR